MMLPDVFFLLTNSIGRAALDATARPGLLQPWIDELDSYVTREGKFSKFAVAYLPLSPPPVFWDYKCRKCRSWTSGTCSLVDGAIRPAGWCAIWTPAPGYRAFTWPQELREGDW
jgi:hypothetical protein